MALHTAQSSQKPLPVWVIACFPGGLGVFIFFVISGYLITTLLLRESDRKGHISLMNFYIRRGFRILPPMYLYVGAMAVLAWWGVLPGLGWRAITAALTFTNGSPYWVFEHFWSLRIEEQFYLIWPVILVVILVLSKRGRGRTVAAWVAVGVITAEPVIRVSSLFIPALRHGWLASFQADGLMFGALGALLQGRARFEAFYRHATRWPWLLPVVLFGVLGVLSIRFLNYWNLPIGFTLEGFVTLMWVCWLIRNPESLQGRMMNHPWVMWVGRLSYSLYIWQTLFLNQANRTVFGENRWWNTVPTSWLCVLVVATVSFYGIEQPALRLRDRLMRSMRRDETALAKEKLVQV